MAHSRSAGRISAEFDHEFHHKICDAFQRFQKRIDQLNHVHLKRAVLPLSPIFMIHLVARRPEHGHFTL